MSDERARTASWSPWPERAYGKLPLPAPVIGFGAVALSFVALVTAATVGPGMEQFVAGNESMLSQRDARAGVLLCVMAGFLPTAQYYVARFTRANLRALGRDGEELARPSRLAVTLPGLLAFPLIALSIDRDPLFYFQPFYYQEPIHWFQWIVGLFVTTNAAWLVHSTVSAAAKFRAISGEEGEIDLFDLSRLEPFARQGVQSVLVWLLLLSMFSINAVDPGFYIPVFCMTLISGSVAAVSLIWCNQGIHRRIRSTKRSELERVDAALRGDATALDRLALEAPRGELSVADLLSYRSFIDDRREWAFDGSAWIRFALVLALPLGSWLGGAIVERLLDASLG